MAKYFTKEQIERLDAVNFPKSYRVAVDHKYATGINCGFTLTLTDIYKATTGETLHSWNCNSCVLNNIKKVGKIYDATLIKLQVEQKVKEAKDAENKIEDAENKIEDKVEEAEEAEDKEVKPTKKTTSKRGRKTNKNK